MWLLLKLGLHEEYPVRPLSPELKRLVGCTASSEFVSEDSARCAIEVKRVFGRFVLQAYVYIGSPIRTNVCTLYRARLLNAVNASLRYRNNRYVIEPILCSELSRTTISVSAQI